MKIKRGILTNTRVIRDKYSRALKVGIPALLTVSAVGIFLYLANAAAGDVVLTPPTGPATGGTSVTMSASSPGVMWSNQTVDFPFGGAAGTTGMEQTFTAPVAGLYKLEVWGAQGGNAPTGGQGGKGGYSTVTVQLNAGQVIYISSGGQGGAANATTGTGGWNGGGGTNNNTGGGGGGASHISTSSGLLSNATVRTNLLVAAGGGGGTQNNGNAGCHGGWGGGTTGGPSQTNVGGGGACTGNGGAGGTQTAGGGSLANQGATGSAGQGATSTQQGGSIYAGGGGGGYFGGGAANGTGGGGGGGSGWLRTAALNGQAITNSSTAAGNTTITEPNGSSATGHTGHGYARVTILASGLYAKPTVQFGTVTIADANVTWCNYNSSVCTNGGPANTVTFITPARGSLPATNNVYLSFNPSKTGEFTYWTPATSYTHQCSVDGGTTWNYRSNIYSGPGSPPTAGALCRIVLNNAFSGTIAIDDGYSAVNSSLSSTITSSDSRFNPSTRTFTVDYTDTYNPAGQILYYNYNSPSWGTLISYWDPDRSNEVALMQPAVAVTPTPNNGVPAIIQAGDAQGFWIRANSYEIRGARTTLSEGSQGSFSITTYGALYTGTITITEDLSHSDNPSGTPGSFSPSTVTFSGTGNPGSFFYTPEVTTVSPSTNYIRLNGNSSPAIANSSLDIKVTPAALRLSGPTTLSRGQYGDYTLTVYDTSINSVELEDLVSAGSANGTYVDLTGSPSGTFNSSTNTYDFSGCVAITIPAAAACVRTFRYTVDSNVSAGLGGDAPYIALSATGDIADAFVAVNITADKIVFACGPGSPNCTIAYVGETSEYAIDPNGIFTGSTTISSPDIGASINFSLSGPTASWSNEYADKILSYVPSAPGRYVLSAATTSTDPGMNGQTYYSNGPGSLTANGGYIWVIANETTFFTGDDTIPNGGSGTYTLALNGPFIGTVILSDNDTVNGVPQGGVFDNGGICDFTLANYDPGSNTSTCTFTYTPTVEPEERTITLAPGFPPEFARPMAITPIDITVFGFPDIRFIDPVSGPSTGGNTVWITGAGLLGVSFITFGGVIDGNTGEVTGGLPCTNLYIINDAIVTCTAPAHAAGQVNVFANNIIPPPDIDDTDPNDPIITPRDPVQYVYFDVATDFVNECSTDGGTTWETEPRVAPGTTVPCRIVLNGRWSGPVTLSDDWSETIDSGLTGIFASSDIRFDSGTNTFNILYADTVEEEDQILEYTWTSPSWNTLKSYWESDGSNEDDLWWPMIEVTIPIDEYEGLYLESTEDNVVFGMLAQEYFMELNGDFPFFCTGCEIAFNLSTFGAPYEGVITLNESLANSDNPSGSAGIFGAEGIFGNNVINFSGSDGAISGFGFVPNTTATGSNFIRVCGVSSSPAITNACFDISPVIDAGITITPLFNSTSLSRGQTGTYTLEVTIGPSWSGTIQLSDVFNVGGAGGGVFADVTVGPDPTGTFNSSTNTYTFTSGETYMRTFTYTLRDDSVTGPLFPSYIMQLGAESNSPNNHAYANVYINSNRIMTRCSLSYPNCTIGRVGMLQDYALQPNGMMVGAGNVTASDAGYLGTATWSAAAPFTMSYTPTAPGRQVITTTITSVSSPGISVGQSFLSTAADSLNDYIWVMANQMKITGPSYLRYGAFGTFTLTMNGPFIGTVNLNDYLSIAGGAAAGGAFSPSSCTFGLGDYDPINNTTSCSFEYTPDLFEYETDVVLASDANSYSGPMTSTPLSIIVYGRPIIDTVSPDSGPTVGGTGFGVGHNPSGEITLTGTSLASGSTLNFDSIFMGNIPISLGNITIIDNNNISFVPPPNAAGEVDIVVHVGSRTYHHPGYYTYIPELSSINPALGPTTGGTGFGASYNSNGQVTITGSDITGAARYSDGTNQYFGLGWLDFNGSQYINTSTNQLGNTRMTIDAIRDSGQYAAGVLVAGDYFTMLLPTTGFMLPTANYGNANATAGGAMNAGDHIVASLDADGTYAEFNVSLNGGPVQHNQIAPGHVPSTPYNIYLGSANNGAGMAGGMTGRIFSFSVNKDTSAASRNLVPVCTMDGTTGGMFDTLNNVFYPSASGTPFTCDLSSIVTPTVTFGGTATSNVTVVDLNTIVATPPPHSPGLVDVVVIVNSIPATLTNAYTYRQPLTVETVFPFIGDLTGGDEVTITGVNFIPLGASPNITVTFDIEGTPGTCTSPTLVDNETITCYTPVRANVGLVSITVSNGVETFTMEALIDPSGNGVYPTQDGLGRSTGGFLYLDDVYIEIDLSTASVDLNVSLSTPFDNDYATVSVITNNATGYELYMQSGGSNLVCTGNGSLTIPSTVLNTVSAGSWAYQIGTSPAGNGWAAAPTSSTLIDQSNSPTFVSPNPETSRDTRVNFAVREGNPTPISRACSLYEQTITYSTTIK